jgi:peroxiredoxin
MRFHEVFLASLLLFALLLLPEGSIHGEEKEMTPLSGAIPMIEGIKMLEVGAQAPDFRIKDANGVTFHYAEEKGKNSVLMVFWSIFCEPCRAEMPFIQKMYEKYKENGLNVVSIALDGEPLKNSIVGFVKQEGYTFRILIDELDAKEMFKAADPYGVAGTPTIYLLDKTGKVMLAKAGRMTEEELEKAIQSLLKK